MVLGCADDRGGPGRGGGYGREREREEYGPRGGGGRGAIFGALLVLK